MAERISDELLAQAPITHDEHARALKELIHERVMQNRRRDADTAQDAALVKLAEENAKAVPVIVTEPPDNPPITAKLGDAPSARLAKSKKEK